MKLSARRVLNWKLRNDNRKVKTSARIITIRSHNRRWSIIAQQLGTNQRSPNELPLHWENQMCRKKQSMKVNYNHSLIVNVFHKLGRKWQGLIQYDKSIIHFQRKEENDEPWTYTNEIGILLQKAISIHHINAQQNQKGPPPGGP